MAEVNLLSEAHTLIDDGSTRALLEEQLASLRDNNIVEDAVVLLFNDGEEMHVKADLGSRYQTKEVRVYNSAASHVGITVQVSEDDISYSSLTGALEGEYAKFTVNAPVRYAKVGQTIGDLEEITPRVTRIDSTTTDSAGNTLLGSSTIHHVEYAHIPDESYRFQAKGWFTEPAQVNVRGKQREIPEHLLVVCTSASLDLINIETLELWMRFNVGTGNMFAGQPKFSASTDTRFYISVDSVGLVVLDFSADKAYRYTTAGDYVSSGGMTSRNSGSISYSDRGLTIAINNILSNTINAISTTAYGSGLLEKDLVGLATNAGVSLLVGNTAVYNSTDGTTPTVSVEVTPRGSVYWAGYDGNDGEVSYLTNFLTVTSGTGISTTFSRDGYWDTTSTPGVLGKNVTDMSAF